MTQPPRASARHATRSREAAPTRPGTSGLADRPDVAYTGGMSDVKAKWNETGAALSGLGAKLKTHYEQSSGSEGDSRQEVGEALARLGDAVREAFDAVGAAAKDPEVREDVKRAANSLTEALVSSFEEAGREVREAYDRRKGSGT